MMTTTTTTTASLRQERREQSFLSTISSRIIVYTLCNVYELSLGYLAAVPFVFAVFLRGIIVTEIQTQQ